MLFYVIQNAQTMVGRTHGDHGRLFLYRAVNCVIRKIAVTHTQPREKLVSLTFHIVLLISQVHILLTLYNISCSRINI